MATGVAAIAAIVRDMFGEFQFRLSTNCSIIMHVRARDGIIFLTECQSKKTT
jgi:hypothetical protein